MHRTWLVLVGFLALALGMFVSHRMYHTLQSKTASAQGVDVVVAAHDIGVGAKIDDKDIKVVRFPTGGLPPNCFHQKSSVVGRGVVLPIAKGEFVLPTKLAGENAGSGMASLIPPGMRAVSVRVSDVIGVAGFVLPGTRVDVLLLTGNPTGGSEEQTTTVLENVAVIASGQKLDRSSSGEPQNTPVITLLVSPEDAKNLTLASSKGRIQLILRHPLQQPMPDMQLKPIPPEVPPSPRLSRLT
jgi:pilus assembly protein CpaB